MHSETILQPAPDLGAALLRIALGIIFLAHSAYLKLFVFTLPGTAAFFASLGLPAVSAYIVFAVEVVGGLCLVTGLGARWAALALAPVAFGAVWVHAGAGWLFTNEGGGWEYPLFLAVACLAQFCLGDGAWAWRPQRMRTVNQLIPEPTATRS